MTSIPTSQMKWTLTSVNTSRGKSDIPASFPAFVAFRVDAPRRGSRHIDQQLMHRESARRTNSLFSTAGADLSPSFKFAISPRFTRFRGAILARKSCLFRRSERRRRCCRRRRCRDARRTCWVDRVIRVPFTRCLSLLSSVTAERASRPIRMQYFFSSSH